MAFDYKGEYQRYRRYFVDLKRKYGARKEMKAYVELAFAVMASAFFIIFAIKPTFITIASLFAEIRAQEDVNKRLEKKIDNLRRAYETMSSVQDKLYLIDQAGPATPVVTTFLRQYELMAGQVGVVVKTFSFDSAEIYGGRRKTGGGSRRYATVQFGSTVSGTYESLSEFVSKLEGMRRLVVLDSFSYTTPLEDEGGMMSLVVSGEVSYIPEDATNETK